MAFMKSQEYQTRFVNGKTSFFVIANLYKSVLNRCPEKKGFLFWVKQLNDMGDVAKYRNILDSFLSSEEYKFKYGVNIVPYRKPQETCPGRP